MTHRGSFTKRNPLILLCFLSLLGCYPMDLSMFSDNKQSEEGISSQDLGSRLIQAVEQDNATSLVELLIKQGAEVNLQDKYGHTPLHVAASINSPAVADLLIQSGAEVNAQNEDGDAPLHYAAKNNSPTVAELLIKSGAEVNAQDKDGKTPLHWAAENNSAAVAELLIKSGAEVNAKDGWAKSLYIGLLFVGTKK
jgi:ankyrin repeat protein